LKKEYSNFWKILRLVFKDWFSTRSRNSKMRITKKNLEGSGCGAIGSEDNPKTGGLHFKHGLCQLLEPIKSKLN